jgi:ETC complex I subunit conserved region
MLHMIHTANEAFDHIGSAPVTLTPSVFPSDAVAIIYKPARSAMTSGKARTKQWKLRFERRHPQFVEPLMGWTGDDDTLTQVELTFPTVSAAINYARRHDLNFVIQTAINQPGLQLVSRMDPMRQTGALALHPTASQARLERAERTLGAEVDTVLARQINSGPAAEYAAPSDVLHDVSLSPEQKWDGLRRWALDTYQLELAPSRGSPQREASRLDDVIDALLELEEMQGAALPRRVTGSSEITPNLQHDCSIVKRVRCA